MEVGDICWRDDTVSLYCVHTYTLHLSYIATKVLNGKTLSYNVAINEEYSIAKRLIDIMSGANAEKY